MDANTAILLGSLGASLASVAVAGIGAYAAIQSGKKSDDNHSILKEMAPTVVALERQTNSILADRDKVSKAAGDKIGEDRGRAAATAEGEAKAAGLAAGQKEGRDRVDEQPA